MKTLLLILLILAPALKPKEPKYSDIATGLRFYVPIGYQVEIVDFRDGKYHLKEVWPRPGHEYKPTYTRQEVYDLLKTQR